MELPKPTRSLAPVVTVDDLDTKLRALRQTIGVLSSQFSDPVVAEYRLLDIDFILLNLERVVKAMLDNEPPLAPSQPSTDQLYNHLSDIELRLDLLDKVVDFPQTPLPEPVAFASVPELLLQLASDGVELTESLGGDAVIPQYLMVPLWEYISRDSVSRLELLTNRAREAASTIEETTVEAACATGSIGESALGSQWLELSHQEATSVKRWRTATVVSAGAAIMVAAAAVFVGYWSAKARWDLFAAKALLVAALGSLAAYCARQAAQHRDAEQYCRQLGVDYLILPAFLADLSATTKEDVKRQIALSRLSGPVLRSASAADEVGPGLTLNTNEMVQLLVEQLKNSKH